MRASEHAIVDIFGEAMVTGNVDVIREAFDKVRAMLGREDQGWVPITESGNWGNDDQYGLRLEDLKQWSKKIRESIVAAPWIGRAFRLRATYVWEHGIRYGNVPGSKESGGGVRGRKNIQNLIDDAGNQFHFFSNEARRAREECLYADGVAFWIGNEATKQLEAIPLWQIDDVLLEPNGLGYALAYKRRWTENNLATGKSEPKERWYFTDRWVSKRVKEIAEKAPGGGNEKVPVDQEHVIFDMHANRSTGLVFGAPDALAAWIWNGIARDAVMDGTSMTRALAAFALKASVKSKEAGQSTALQLASPQGAASTFVAGQANDLVPLSSAGKGYDFGSLLFLVSIVAAATDVSVVHLTANPGDAGGSYGASQTLDLPTRLAMEFRRDVHIDMDKRVLRWMGVEDPDVTFVPFISGDETYRAIQSLLLEFSADTMTRQELRDRLDDLMGRPDGLVPSEDERPSALAAKALAKVAPKPAPGAPGGTPKQTAAPDQGRSNGTGGSIGGNASNDIRRGKK